MYQFPNGIFFFPHLSPKLLQWSHFLLHFFPRRQRELCKEALGLWQINIAAAQPLKCPKPVLIEIPTCTMQIREEQRNPSKQMKMKYIPPRTFWISWYLTVYCCIMKRETLLTILKCKEDFFLNAGSAPPMTEHDKSFGIYIWSAWIHATGVRKTTSC